MCHRLHPNSQPANQRSHPPHWCDNEDAAIPAIVKYIDCSIRQFPIHPIVCIIVKHYSERKRGKQILRV